MLSYIAIYRREEKNGTKIKKTADKHRSLKRTKDTCRNISKAAKERFANGQKSFTLGKVKIFNKVMRTVEYVLPEIKVKLMSSGYYTDEQLCNIVNENGEKFWHPKSEPIPNGFNLFKRKSPIK